MNVYQISQLIKTKLQTRQWGGAGETVFPYNSVKITNNPDLQAFLTLPVPFALIVVGDFQSDPVHNEEPTYLIGTIVVKIGIAHQDSMGEAAIIGSNKVGGTTSSKGRGLEEIAVEVMDTIAKLNQIDGVSMQFVAKGNNQTIPDLSAGYRATKDFAFECIASADPE